MNDWLTTNARNQTQPADKWYADFANRLLPLIDSSPLYAGHTFYDLTQTAIRVSLYFYDTIAQSGGWKVFCDKYRQLYHQTLPFYECTDYIDDEINLPDVCLLLWDSLSQPALLPDEDHPELQAFADLHAPFISRILMTRNCWHWPENCMMKWTACSKKRLLAKYLHPTRG